MDFSTMTKMDEIFVDFGMWPIMDEKFKFSLMGIVD